MECPLWPFDVQYHWPLGVSDTSVPLNRTFIARRNISKCLLENKEDPGFNLNTVQLIINQN